MEKEKSLLDEIIENTINFIDLSGNEIKLDAKATRRQYAPTATDAEWEQFVDTIQANGLDPRRKEVYFTKYNTKDGPKVSIVTGYQVYLARAFKSEKLAKIPEVRVIKPDERDMMTWYGEVDITRKDMDGTATWKTPMKEANKSQALWNIMPEFMLKKTTGPQGLRYYLADVIGGLPYTIEEIASGISESEEYIEGDIEPSDEEAQKAEKAKTDYLKKVSATIEKFSTIDKINEYYNANDKNYKTSAFYDDIKAVFGERKRELANIIMAKNMKIDVQDLIDFRIAVKGDGIDKTLIEQILAGNTDACKELKTRIENWKKERDAKVDQEAEAEPESEVDDAEAALDAMSDARSNEA